MHNLALSDFVGICGTILLILAYFLLQHGRVKSNDALYLYMNLSAAILILFSLCFTFNLASFVIEVFWIGISFYGIWKRKRSKT